MQKGLVDLKEYGELLNDILFVIKQTRLLAAYSLNNGQIQLYFEIGKKIVSRQKTEKWGKRVVEQLSLDIAKDTGANEGFSPQNLWFMRQFYLEYHQDLKLFTLACLIPWGQNIVIFSKIKDKKEQAYYLQATGQMGWSRNVLLNQIKADTYRHHKLLPKQHNFTNALPDYLAEQADEMLKSKYNLDFLGLTRPIHERELENRLIEKLKTFLLELGYGFTFMGNQYRIDLQEKEYFVDLLFFHRKLKCLVAIDLKIGQFKPEFAGKMNFYLNLLDDVVRMQDENPSIGIILCADKNAVEVEYSLKGIDKPIAVAEYELKKNVPRRFYKQLPTPKELNDLVLKEINISL